MARTRKPKCAGAPSKDGAPLPASPRIKDAIRALEWPPAVPTLISTYSRDLLTEIQNLENGRHARRGAVGAGVKRSRKREIALIALIMLENCARYESPPPRVLVELLSYLIVKQSADRDTLFWALMKAEGRPRPTTEMFAAIDYELKHHRLSENAVAKAIGVTNKTITAWRKNKSYRRYFEVQSNAIKQWPWLRR